MKFLTHEKAKTYIKELTEYIELIEKYEVNDIRTYIIKSYTETGSVVGIIRKALNEESYYYKELSSDMIKATLLSTVKDDELHKRIKKAYKSKIAR